MTDRSRSAHIGIGGVLCNSEASVCRYVDLYLAVTQIPGGFLCRL